MQILRLSSVVSKFANLLMSSFKVQVCSSSNGVMAHNSCAFFRLKHNIFSTKAAHQSANFQTCHCLHQNSPNSSCHFWNQESVFLQTLHHSSVSGDILFVLFHLQLHMLWAKGTHQSASFRTFDCSFYKPQVSFPLHFALPFSVMTHNSSEIF